MFVTQGKRSTKKIQKLAAQKLTIDDDINNIKISFSDMVIKNGLMLCKDCFDNDELVVLGGKNDDIEQKLCANCLELDDDE